MARASTLGKLIAYTVSTWHRFWICSVVGMLLSAPTFASDPVFVGTLANGSSLYYVLAKDAGTIKTVQTRLAYSSPQVEAGIANVMASVSIDRIDCQKLTRTTLRLELYDNADANGKPIWSADLPASDKDAVELPVESRTAIMIVVESICHPIAVAGVPGGAQPTNGTQSVAQAIGTPPTTPTVPQAPPATQVLPVLTSQNPLSTPSGPNTSSPPMGPLVTQYPAAPVSTPYDAPMAISAIADSKPFPEQVFTLGQMGKLAEYVYYDDEEYQFLTASLDKARRIREKVSQDERMHMLVEEAYRRIVKRVSDYQEMMAAKRIFLQAAQLVRVPLPAIKAGPVTTFYAELYREKSTGETILVLRGTKTHLDWISNVWLGVDLLKIEAPHYQAARQVTEAILKSGIKPIVVGHSLGGGMAQYVGLQFGLKVVGFNSSPLPTRYIPATAGTKVQFIKLYSAVEHKSWGNGTANQNNPDPVSISLPQVVDGLHEIFGSISPLKAHQHLVKPICVVSEPRPFISDKEQQSFYTIVADTLSSGVVTALNSGLLATRIEKGLQFTIKDTVKRGMADPVWRPDSRAKFDKRVAELVKTEVTKVAIDTYKMIGGTTKAGKKVYDFASGRTWSALSYLGVKAGEIALKMYAIEAWLMPHSMERFNRGMRAEVTADVFLAETVRVQCRTPATTY